MDWEIWWSVFKCELVIRGFILLGILAIGGIILAWSFLKSSKKY